MGKEYRVQLHGEEAVCVKADKMEVREDRLVFLDEAGELVASFSHPHVGSAVRVK